MTFLDTTKTNHIMGHKLHYFWLCDKDAQELLDKKLIKIILQDVILPNIIFKKQPKVQSTVPYTSKGRSRGKGVLTSCRHHVSHPYLITQIPMDIWRNVKLRFTHRSHDNAVYCLT